MPSRDKIIKYFDDESKKGSTKYGVCGTIFSIPQDHGIKIFISKPQRDDIDAVKEEGHVKNKYEEMAGL